MGWKNSVAIHLGFWLYLLGGGLIYFYIENSAYIQPSPNKQITFNSTFCQDLEELVKAYPNPGVREVLKHTNVSALLAAVADSCRNLTLAFNTKVDSNGGVVWEYSSALFLCMTILTTIGYGNYSPKTNGGKVFCILYGFVGIPICGIFLASNTNYFSNIFLRLYEKQKARHKDKRNSIVIAAIVFLLPGLAVFLFVPSAIFTVLENWNYLDAVYYSFISLATIGFGDDVAAQHPSSLLSLYRICLIFWVTLGIAYWAIIIAFIVKALKSKELSKRWKRTSHAIAEQAKEMRRSMERQIFQSNFQKNDSFVALKTKATLEFALKLTDSMGNLRVNIQPDSPILSLKTKANLHDPEEELITMKELPVKTFSRHDKRPLDHLGTISTKEQVEKLTLGTCRRRTSLSVINNTLQHPKDIFDNHSVSISTDSGFDSFDYVNITPMQMKSPNSSSQMSIQLRKNSSSSLPPNELQLTLELKEVSGQIREFHNEWEIVRETQGFWHHFRSISRVLTTILRQLPSPRKLYQNYKAPSVPPASPARLSPQASPPFVDLLMEAMMILQEAEFSGSNLTDE